MGHTSRTMIRDPTGLWPPDSEPEESHWRNAAAAPSFSSLPELPPPGAETNVMDVNHHILMQQQYKTPLEVPYSDGVND